MGLDICVDFLTAEVGDRPTQLSHEGRGEPVDPTGRSVERCAV